MRLNVEALEKEIASFPENFGLRAFPGKIFRVSKEASYVSEGRIELYVFVRAPGEEWLAWGKGSPEELRSELTELLKAAEVS